jgi:hypothetical protein
MDIPNSATRRSSPVEAASWLVEEEHPRASQDLNRNTDAPLLAAAEAANVPVSDGRVGAVLEAHFNDCALHDGFLLSW